jgi:hypothetical protein
MHPSIAPHQIDVTKSNRICWLAASGSWTGVIASHSALVPAAGGWSAATTVSFGESPPALKTIGPEDAKSMRARFKITLGCPSVLIDFLSTKLW